MWTTRRGKAAITSAATPYILSATSTVGEAEASMAAVFQKARPTGRGRSSIETRGSASTPVPVPSFRNAGQAKLHNSSRCLGRRIFDAGAPVRPERRSWNLSRRQGRGSSEARHPRHNQYLQLDSVRYLHIGRRSGHAE